MKKTWHKRDKKVFFCNFVVVLSSLHHYLNVCAYFLVVMCLLLVIFQLFVVILSVFYPMYV